MRSLFSSRMTCDALLFLFLFAASTRAQQVNNGFNVKTHPSMNIGLTTTDDTIYTVDITLGGQDFTVLLDTGSSDLWVNTQGRDVKLTNTTDLVAGEVYGLGQVQGTLEFAELRIGDYVVPSQAFINATQVSNIGAPVDGYMGISFDVSNVTGTILQAWGVESARTLGRSFITNLFAQNASLPNNFDIQLGRTTRMDEVANGTFIISGHSSTFGDVTEAPKLPRVGSTRWTVVMDEMRIDGERFPFNKSSVTGAPEGKVAALLDTGFSAPPLPPAAVDAIYKSIPGAVYWATGGAYVVPCNSSTMLSFVFDGQEFAVHPLDLALPLPAPIIKDGKQTNVTVCLATYQYLNLDPTSFAGFDLILGDAFLRSVYASFDYGDSDPMNNSTTTPFVQLLTTVDRHTAMAEFYEERTAALAGMPPTIEPSQFIQYPLATAAGSNTTVSSGSQTDAVSGALSTDDDGRSGSSDNTLGIAAIALLSVNLLVGLALLGVTVTMCTRSMKGKSVGSRYVPVRLKEAAPLEEDSERGVPRYSDA
ncbi:aspartic peptidase domain-containing protein [Trametes polyzona]|nr:aspartic peptidase domain-containing protein [Trametes polyzona]